MDKSQNSNDNIDRQTIEVDQMYQPLMVRCLQCGVKVVPIQKIRPSCKTHLLATILFLLFCPCSILPYYMDNLQVTELYCPHCNSYIMTI